MNSWLRISAGDYRRHHPAHRLPAVGCVEPFVEMSATSCDEEDVAVVRGKGEGEVSHYSPSSQRRAALRGSGPEEACKR